MTEDKERIGAVMVVGGGISGIQASLDLANSGYKVYLVEESPSIGGRMAQLDKTFPTNDCSMCILSPKLIECGHHPNIELITFARVDAVEGEPGRFTVEVVKAPRYVDEDKCTACGTCQEKCPWKVDSEFNEGLGTRKAIYTPFPQAIPNIPVIDTEHCAYFQKGTCRACEKFCAPGAIDFEQKEKRLELEVGTIVLAPGYERFDPRLKEEYAYGRAPNVVTSLEFERILSASGPYQGEVLRPSDMQHPKRIAWIQCVGSRDAASGRDYCSSVCCMYATKQVLVAREHVHDLEATVFYNDIRAFGKGFERYYETARNTPGVRYISSIVSSVRERQQSHNLLLRYSSNGEVKEEEFDLVVLSVGLRPSPGTAELAEKLSIELNKYGFCKTNGFSMIETSRPGIYVAGAFYGPMDIPESVTMASGAASLSSQILSAQRGTLVTPKVYPPERDTSNEELRIGVFVCHCGINIAGVVDVPAVMGDAKTLDGVVHVEENLFSCSADATVHIKEVIKEKNLNRVVVASCTPRTHEPLFQETLREAGLNPYLFSMANIRDQCSWVHMQQPEEATAKAKDLVRMAVSRARLLQPLHKLSLGLSHDALVIGGGVAGMSAALALANQGFKVYLVEREKEVGGWVRKIHVAVGEDDPQEFLRSLVERVQANELIEVLTETSVVKSDGFIGNFKTTLATEGGQKQRVIEHGVTIVASGASEYRGTEFLLGQDERVLTLSDLEAKIAESPEEIARARDVVMVLCVGPSGAKGSYCSRVCCTVAIKNALKIKEMDPEANIYILCKDVRTYGYKEELYAEARSKGILFIRYQDEAPPQAYPANGKLVVSFIEPALGRELLLEPELLVLATGMVPSEGSEELARILRVPITEQGFFHEAHVKLAPVDFASEGIFMCGSAHSPKFIDEAIAQGLAAASRATVVLSKEQLEVGGAVAQVDTEKCIGCLTCVRVCPYQVPVIRDEVAYIEVASCQGCGVCAAECPAKAIELLHYRPEQVMAALEALLAPAGS